MASSLFSYLLILLFVFPVIVSSSTHIHFYLHDTLVGPNVTAVRVVSGPQNASSLNFGDVFMFDDPLTESPNRLSKIVDAITKDGGKAQGFYAVVSQDEDITLLMNFNMVFSDGEYNGSSIAVTGTNRILSAVRELPVVGGTGRFRMARGYVLDKSYELDTKTGNAILEYDVYVDC